MTTETENLVDTVYVPPSCLINFRSDCVLCRVLLYLLVTQLIQTQYISGVKSKSRVTSIMSDS